MSNYLRRLSIHPGVPMATAMSIAGLIAGLQRPDGNWAVGLIMLVVWIPVLITAASQPLPGERHGHSHYHDQRHDEQ